ncbi:MAG: tRNA(Ile)-lysidine synthase [Halieaceae bacterium]|jgi:tRNA(Ile)-lysidine synthase
MDSSVLLHAVARLYPDRTIALHANHALHGDALQWQRHCARCCELWSLPLRSETLSISARGDGPEAEARAARYAWFETQVGAGDVLLLAHHLDDQVETLLLRLLRGAGLHGLSGIPVQRPLGQGGLLRPLLGLPRDALRTYAQHEMLEWIEDPSNADSAYDRNFLRRDVLPIIETRWPGYRNTLGRAAGHLRAVADQQPVTAPRLLRSAVGDPGFSLSTLPVADTDAAAAVRSWLRRAGLPMPAAAPLAEFLRQLRQGGGATLRTREWVLERYRDAVFCRRVLPSLPWTRQKIDIGECLEHPAFGRVSVEARGAGPPAVSLSLCFRRGGERLLLADGAHHRFKTLCQERGIPPWWRARLPLLYAGEELLALGPFLNARSATAEQLVLSWDPPLPETPDAAPLA